MSGSVSMGLEVKGGSKSMELTLGREIEPMSSVVTGRIFGAIEATPDLAIGISPSKTSSMGCTSEQEDSSKYFNQPIAAKDLNNVALELPQFRFAFLTKPKVSHFCYVLVFVI